MQNDSGGKYVPPHLRGRGSGDGRNKHNPSGNSNNNKSLNSNASSNRNSNPGSRWKDLGNGNDGNRHGHGARTNASHNNNGNSNSNSRGNHRSGANGNSGGGSRWGNVNRTAITEGNGRTYGHGHERSDNKNNNNDDTRRRSDKSMFDRHTLESKQRNYRPRDHHDLSEVRAIFFGDSFIKLFGLLNEYSDSVLKTPRTIEVQKYKAASAKGLYREGNENRTKICQTMDYIRRQNSTNNLNKMYQHLERLVFCFGSVDVHMSFYFKKFAKHQGLTDDDLRDIATNYVDFVAGLETGSSTNPQQQQPLTKLIVGIYPSPLCDKHVGASLLAYGSLENPDQVAAVDASDDKTIESRQARVDLFNQTLKERCCFHNEKSAEGGGGNGILEYWDVRDEILTLNEDGRPRVKDAYKDVSDLNIHLIHETTLQLWVSKWPWYEALTTSGEHRDSTGFLGYLQETFDEYRKTKPWAERTHVAETSGVRLT